MKSTQELDFKGFCDNYIDKIKGGYAPKNHRGFIVACMKQFGISEAVFYRRFKSYYGGALSEVAKINHLPSKERLIEEILKSDNVNDLWERLELSSHYRSGLFDKYFGVSTFERAKAKIMMLTFENSYKPSVDENKSLVASQVLGDGSYSSTRGSIRISHGEKQIGYALWKASLFNKAFPTTKPSGSTSILLHTQGHRYSSWCSGRLPSKITSWLEKTPKRDLVRALSPFGMLLLFLDDGYMNFDMLRRGNTYVLIYVHDNGVLESLVEELSSYGVNVTNSNNNLKIGTYESAIKFYKCFVEPYKKDIPECMQYKCLMKI